MDRVDELSLMKQFAAKIKYANRICEIINKKSFGD